MVLSGLGLCASLAVIPFARTYLALLLLLPDAAHRLQLLPSHRHRLDLQVAGRFGPRARRRHGHPERLGEPRRRAGLPDGRLPGPGLGLEDAALRLGPVRPRPGRTRAPWALRGVSSRSEERPSLRPADWWRSLRCHPAVHPGLLLRRARAGRSPSTTRPPSSTTSTASPWGRRACSWRSGSDWGPSPATATAPGAAGSDASASSWPAWAAPPRPSSCSASPRPRAWPWPACSPSAASSS
ncbi:MAG: hypothetical protein MZU79_06335 [Anaerotruncus sp.]|nr:hypothetical protein [Anaerotruncus sp.]